MTFTEEFGYLGHSILTHSPFYPHPCLHVVDAHRPPYMIPKWRGCSCSYPFLWDQKCFIPTLSLEDPQEQMTVRDSVDITTGVYTMTFRVGQCSVSLAQRWAFAPDPLPLPHVLGVENTSLGGSLSKWRTPSLNFINFTTFSCSKVRCYQVLKLIIFLKAKAC